MEIVFTALGVGLLVVTVVEALWTTLWVDGAAGPVTSRVTSWAWVAVRRLGRGRHRLLSMCGPLILIGTVVGWVLALWAGWVLLFAADPQSLADTRDGGNATWPGRIWFVGYTLFTVGNGDFSPKDGMWQVLAGLVSASGMFLVTLSVTYLLSVVSAVVNKRAFASSVHSLGRTGAEVVLAGWNGHDLHPLDRQLAELTSQLSKLTEQYLSYPVLLYYHAARAQKSPALAVGVFDDALTLLRFGVPTEARPDEAELTAARTTVDGFLDTLEAAFIPAADQAPPHPELDRLRAAGIPIVEEAEFSEAVDGLDGRRRSLLGLVRHDGWTWWKD